MEWDYYTNTERPFCGARFLLSVAHLEDFWVRHRILATKIISVAHQGRAPQKVQLSVAHPARCATEIARQHPYAEEFYGALFLGAPQKVVRHKKIKPCATEIWNNITGIFFILLYKYRYIQDLSRNTDIFDRYINRHTLITISSHILLSVPEIHTHSHKSAEC